MFCYCLHNNGPLVRSSIAELKINHEALIILSAFVVKQLTAVSE